MKRASKPNHVKVPICGHKVQYKLYKKRNSYKYIIMVTSKKGNILIFLSSIFVIANRRVSTENLDGFAYFFFKENIFGYKCFKLFNKLLLV